MAVTVKDNIMKNTKVRSHSRSTKGKGNTTVRSHARTVKGTDHKGKVRHISVGHHTEMMAGRGVGKNIHQKINDRLLEMDEAPVGRKLGKRLKKSGRLEARLAMFQGKQHSITGKGNKAKRRGTKK